MQQDDCWVRRLPHRAICYLLTVMGREVPAPASGFLRYSYRGGNIKGRRNLFVVRRK